MRNSLILILLLSTVLLSCSAGKTDGKTNVDSQASTDAANNVNTDNSTTVIDGTEGDPTDSKMGGDQSATIGNPFDAAAGASGGTTGGTYSGGITVKNIKMGTGPVVKQGELLLTHLRHYGKGTEDFINTRQGEGNTQPIAIGQPQFKGDIMEVLATLKKGSHVVISVPADSLYRQNRFPPGVSKGMMVFYEVEVIKVVDRAAYEAEQKQIVARNNSREVEVLAQYVKQNGLNAQKTASGLYYVVEKQGVGPKAKAGQTVSVHYTGKLLDGTKFDSSHDRGKPIEFPLGQGRVIRGWDEGIALMNVGSKMKLIIPNGLAYGERSPSPKIPAYSPLVFDVELMEIK